MKKFFTVNVGNTARNEALYNFLVGKGIIDVVSVETASTEVKAVIRRYDSRFNDNDLPVYKVVKTDGTFVFVIETLRTETVDVTYEEFLAWLNDENLVEDLDVSYDDYLEEHNLEPVEEPKFFYNYHMFDQNEVVFKAKQETINNIKASMKILPILEKELEDLKESFNA